MKLFSAILGLMGSIALAVPEPVITTMSSYNGYATIAGHLDAKPGGPIGVSVRNGSLISSTITDIEGRWGIVIRHLGVQVTVQTWDLARPSDLGQEMRYDLATAEVFAPWTREVYATGSSSSETSAKYHTETNLRYEIDRERDRCDRDNGKFSSSQWQTTCNKSGFTYSCRASATCFCRESFK